MLSYPFRRLANLLVAWLILIEPGRDLIFPLSGRRSAYGQWHSALLQKKRQRVSLEKS